VKVNHIYLILFSVLLLNSCGDSANQAKEQSKDASGTASIVPPKIRDTALLYDFGKSFEVLVKAPKTKFKGTILVLQGWNFPNTSWCDNSELCEKALEEGYFLVMPAMEKSIYHFKTYDATRKDWADNPTRDWLMKSVCADLEKKYGLFSPKHNNYILGLSTGGRGALLLAQENPEIFVAGASLSGDYDQSAFPDDNLYRGYFGKDPEKWDAKENPIATIDNWKVPMYIGHGEMDSVVSIQHAKHLQQMTDGFVPHLRFEYSFVPTAGHDYLYWSAEVGNILRFFERYER